jgi:Holliday junction resolvasome RuvABC DNA-binding subunit
MAALYTAWFNIKELSILTTKCVLYESQKKLFPFTALTESALFCSLRGTNRIFKSNSG